MAHALLYCEQSLVWATAAFKDTLLCWAVPGGRFLRKLVAQDIFVASRWDLNSEFNWVDSAARVKERQWQMRWEEGMNALAVVLMFLRGSQYILDASHIG